MGTMNKKAKNLHEVSEMLTVQEAAKLKGVTDTRVYQWIAEGRLKTQEAYGRTLIIRNEVLNLEPQRRGRPPTASTQKPATGQRRATNGRSTDKKANKK